MMRVAEAFTDFPSAHTGRFLIDTFSQARAGTGSLDNCLPIQFDWTKIPSCLLLTEKKLGSLFSER
jgi:hypothetical protein